MGWVRCAEIVGGYQKRYFGTLIPNIYIDNNSGAEVSYAGWSATDFLEVSGDTTVMVGTPDGNQYYNCFYDENKNYISYFYSNARPITIPSNARYLRVSAESNAISPLAYFYYLPNKRNNMSFIASTNAQQLNLPVYMDEGVVIKTKLMTPTPLVNPCSIINNEWNLMCMALYFENGLLTLRSNSSSTTTINKKMWEWVDIEFNTTNGSLIYDGVTYGGNGGSYNHKIIQLFGIDESRYSAVAFQDIEIYKNGNLYAHLIPRKDEQTGDGYFYDVIGEQSYYSATSTPLIYGERPLD